MFRYCVLVSVLLACVAAQYYGTSTPKPDGDGNYCYVCEQGTVCNNEMDMSSYDTQWCAHGCYVMTNMDYGYEYTMRGCYEPDAMNYDSRYKSCNYDYCNNWRVDSYFSSATTQSPLLLLAPVAAVLAKLCSS